MTARSELDDLALSYRSQNQLKRAGIFTIAELIDKSPDELLQIPNFGVTSLQDVEKCLNINGLTLSGKESKYFHADSPIDDLALSYRSQNQLKRAGIFTIAELIDKSPDELLQIPNFGVTSLQDVEKCLNINGLREGPLLASEIHPEHIKVQTVVNLWEKLEKISTWGNESGYTDVINLLVMKHPYERYKSFPSESRSSFLSLLDVTDILNADLETAKKQGDGTHYQIEEAATGNYEYKYEILKSISLRLHNIHETPNENSLSIQVQDITEEFSDLFNWKAVLNKCIDETEFSLLLNRSPLNRLPFRKIAESYGITAEAVRRRIKRIEKKLLDVPIIFDVSYNLYHLIKRPISTNRLKSAGFDLENKETVILLQIASSFFEDGGKSGLEVSSFSNLPQSDTSFDTEWLSPKNNSLELVVESAFHEAEVLPDMADYESCVEKILVKLNLLNVLNRSWETHILEDSNASRDLKVKNCCDEHRNTAQNILNSVLEIKHHDSIPGKHYISDWNVGSAARAVRVLKYIGEPMHQNALLREIESSYEKTSLSDFSQNSELIRVEAKVFGLSQWGLSEYRGIVGHMIEAIESTQNGVMNLEELAWQLNQSFSINLTSVRMYASNDPRFLLTEGDISVRDTSEVITFKPMHSHSSNVFVRTSKNDRYWANRILADSEWFRGSGIGLNPSFADHLGLVHGGAGSLSLKGLSLDWTWRGQTPNLSNTRKLRNLVNATPNQYVLLIAIGELQLDFTLVNYSGNTLNALDDLFNFFHIDISSEEKLSEIAISIGLSAESPIKTVADQIQTRNKRLRKPVEKELFSRAFPSHILD